MLPVPSTKQNQNDNVRHRSCMMATYIELPMAISTLINGQGSTDILSLGHFVKKIRDGQLNEAFRLNCP